jgi:polyadenylate-binding protein 2
MHENQ